MASKKKKPSQRLRHEVSEYTSLIRTLHTSSTRDIVPHLVGVFPPPLPPTRNQSSDEFKPIDSSSESSDHAAKKAQRSNKRKGVHSETIGDRDSSTEPSARGGIWDRWPLLQQSVHVPEWTLQDEVKAIAERTIKDWIHENHGSASATDASISESLLSQSTLYGLSLEASTFLSHIFGLLAAHRPAHDASLQNRLKATDWKTTLSILTASEIISHDNIETAKATMERIFGPFDLISRSIVKSNAKRKLTQVKRALGDRDDLFSCPTKLPYRKRRRRI
ncbi:hypothetical protein CPB86DRAFT_764544 [Serendipita vermifera]|nr:hypothetical protein CPB86DRAFT_764544 [Serendipita vermifera]